MMDSKALDKILGTLLKYCEKDDLHSRVYFGTHRVWASNHDFFINASFESDLDLVLPGALLKNAIKGTTNFTIEHLEVNILEEKSLRTKKIERK